MYITKFIGVMVSSSYSFNTTW